MKFIDKLDLLMAEKQISRAELARLSNVPYTTIVGFYEKGYENTKLSTLQKLVEFFGCSLDYLADDEVDEDIKMPATISDDGRSKLDSDLVKLLTSLTPDEAVLARTIVQGIKDARNK